MTSSRSLLHATTAAVCARHRPQPSRIAADEHVLRWARLAARSSSYSEGGCSWPSARASPTDEHAARQDAEHDHQQHEPQPQQHQHQQHEHQQHECESGDGGDDDADEQGDLTMQRPRALPLSPHCLLSGWLLKRSRFLQQWRMRWVELSPNKLVARAAACADSTPTLSLSWKLQGGAPSLMFIEDRVRTPPKPQFSAEPWGLTSFDLKFGGTVYAFEADSARERDAWVRALRGAAVR
jgi:hypothetical protein